MTDQQTLEKAIRIAIKNGWQGLETAHHGQKVWEVVPSFDGSTQPSLFTWVPDAEYPNQQARYNDAYQQRAVEVLFNHEFAKALFGEENFMRYDGDTLDPLKVWEWHLQQMVIGDNPIAYLRDNLPNA